MSESQTAKYRFPIFLCNDFQLKSSNSQWWGIEQLKEKTWRKVGKKLKQLSGVQM